MFLNKTFMVAYSGHPYIVHADIRNIIDHTSNLIRKSDTLWVLWVYCMLILAM